MVENNNSETRSAPIEKRVDDEDEIISEEQDVPNLFVEDIQSDRDYLRRLYRLALIAGVVVIANGIILGYVFLAGN